ncbi:hypothetical protein ACFE04_016899 [Oxalis oulophora]
MEGNSNKGFKNYFRKKGYERLDGSSTTGRRRRYNKVELGARGGSGGRKRFWRVKIVPRVRVLLKRASPKGFFIWLRDAYMNMMMSLANSRALSNGYGGGIGNGLAAFGQRPVKEYDERMILEIYKAILMSHGNVINREAAKLGI